MNSDSMRRRLALAIAQALVAGGAVQAADITVDSTAADVADDGFCTLPEAVLNANNDSQNNRTSAGECATGEGADRIILPPDKDFSFSSAYAAGTALPLVSADLTIDGNNSRLERDSNLPCELADRSRRNSDRTMPT